MTHREASRRIPQTTLRMAGLVITGILSAASVQAENPPIQATSLPPLQEQRQQDTLPASLPPLQDQRQPGTLPPIARPPVAPGSTGDNTGQVLPAQPAPAQPVQAAPEQNQPPPAATPPAKVERANTWLPATAAKLQALDKVNAQASDLTIKVGQSATFGTLTITVKSCVVRPADQPADSAAYLDVTDSHPDQPGFDGWMLQNEPSVSMMQHPIYDLRVTGCA
jgi:hypothetical protein